MIQKYYRAKKRCAAAVPLEGIDPGDRREEAEVGKALVELVEKLTPRQQRVVNLQVKGLTPAEIAADLGCSESLVYMEQKAVRSLLQTG
jgi:DNA-directed RNA polymerase specialized sigma24 family protein